MQTTTSDKQKTRTEIYSKLWNAVRTVKTNLSDGEFKSYIFSFIFYRRISEFQESGLDKVDGGNKRYRTFGPTRTFLDKYGYIIQPEVLFENVRKKINKESCIDAEDELRKAFEVIAAFSTHEKFKGLLNIATEGNRELNVESPKERNESIKLLMNSVAEMDIDFNNDEIDFIGDIYEYLIGIKESNSKKVAGQYYTPQEIARLLSLIGTTAKEVNSIYDPTCGTGSLLLKAKRLFPKAYVYGQEINQTSSKLCRMNLIMKETCIDEFDIRQGDTLLNDKFKESEFDLIVANPPFSLKWDGPKNEELLEDPRFNGLVAPSNFADWAFIQHALYHLREGGLAAITCFPGCLYRERVEKQIRKGFVENNYVDCVIQLPENIFYGTSISTAIIVLRKDRTNKDVLFIDASKECEFRAIRNYLNDDHINKIFKLYKDRKEVEGLARLVSKEEIENKDGNLSVNTYIDNEEEEEEIDIKALNQEISDRGKKLLRDMNKLDELVRDLDEDSKSIPTVKDIAKKGIEGEDE